MLSISQPFQSGNMSFCPGTRVLFFLFCPCSEVSGILVPQPGIEPMILQWNLNHWTTREVPFLHFSFWLGTLVCRDERAKHFQHGSWILANWFWEKRKEGKEKEKWNASLYNMYYVKAFRQYKRKIDKQKGFSDVSSNLLQQIGWFRDL